MCVCKLPSYFFESSPFIYFEINWLRYDKIQLKTGYYEKYDPEEDKLVLVQFPKTPHFIFKIFELNLIKRLHPKHNYIIYDKIDGKTEGKDDIKK